VRKKEEGKSKEGAAAASAMRREIETCFAAGLDKLAKHNESGGVT